ncbi:MAG: lytic transglycosylase domain-containing protein, partial [Verrucomicrobiae bacterium]|nr:lytic transglycosylase domain-containing protein [Verrucomicrobiae bacterium]
MFKKIFILVCLLALLGAGAYFGRRYFEDKRVHRFDALIAKVAAENSIDPQLVRAVVWRETNFVPESVGLDGERGLMQLMPDAAADYARIKRIRNFNMDSLFDPETNLRVGSWYLSRALARWKEKDSPLTFALAEYNAGRRNALRWAAVNGEQTTAAEFMTAMDFPTTAKYVRTIMAK